MGFLISVDLSTTAPRNHAEVSGDVSFPGEYLLIQLNLELFESIWAAKVSAYSSCLRLQFRLIYIHTLVDPRLMLDNLPLFMGLKFRSLPLGSRGVMSGKGGSYLNLT